MIAGRLMARQIDPHEWDVMDMGAEPGMRPSVGIAREYDGRWQGWLDVAPGKVHTRGSLPALLLSLGGASDG